VGGLNPSLSIAGEIYVIGNAALEDISGLSSLGTVSGEFAIHDNWLVPCCDICDLLDQLTATPPYIDAEYNMHDACDPVPDNCP